MAEKLNVKAVDPKGHWAFGRFWPHMQTVELELVDEPAAERALEGDDLEAAQKRYALRVERISAGRATAAEADRIRAYPHLVEVKVPRCEKCDAFRARVAELEALLADATAPRKGGK